MRFKTNSSELIAHFKSPKLPFAVDFRCFDDMLHWTRDAF